MEYLKGYFQKKPVIAGIRTSDQFEGALQSKAIALFILSGDILQLPHLMKRAEDHDKLVFLHIDLIEGIGRDAKGVEYLAINQLCNGIVSTKSNLIKAAKRADLLAIQRLFLLDSAALKTGKNMLKQNRPDAVEILPGFLASYFIQHSNESVCPIIAGGLIRSADEVKKLLKDGVMAVSTSNQQLWYYENL